MCSFFSFVGDGYGNFKYFDWEYRKNHLSENCDSHTAILTHFQVPPKMQDKWSNYEYNPITKKFTVDQGREGHDHEWAENFANELNFKPIVEPLIMRDIVNPLTKKKRKPTQKTIDELHAWIAVGGSVLIACSKQRGSTGFTGGAVGGAVWNAIGEAVGEAVEGSVWGAFRCIVGRSFWNAVWVAVRRTVEGSVWLTVVGSVRDAAYGYISSFFDVQYSYDFSPCVKLWNKGYVPLFDGTTWRLHSGPKMEIVYEEKI